ncbi:MAG TPA: FadR/GntR family transcriptional regulator [Prosthecobacter sp.]|nr:FadR/GntR family transcriptional regulator [Prosthecobacter sp.]
MTLQPIQDDRLSLVEKVCRRLSQAIRQAKEGESDLLPPERDLAAQFGVSRPVVREAMKRLELQGLLEVRHGIGTRVVNRLHAPLNGSITLLIEDGPARLKQSLEVRAALEPEVARLAAERITPAGRKRLRAVHQKLESAQTLPEAIEADIEFHRELARASGNEIFALVLNSMADLGRASRQATISFAGVEVARRHHSVILEAVVSGKAKEAAEAMRQHLEAAMADLSGGRPRKR